MNLTNINVPLFAAFLFSLIALVLVTLVGANGVADAKAVQLDSLTFALGAAVAGNSLPAKTTTPAA